MLDGHSCLQRRTGVGDQLSQLFQDCGVSQDVGPSVLKLGKSQANWDGWSCKKEQRHNDGYGWHLGVRIRHFLNFSITSFSLSSEINIPVLLSRVLQLQMFFTSHPHAHVL